MQGLVDMRAKQALASIDDVWQLPILSSLSNEQRKALAPLLAVDSQAFTALITATDSASLGQQRQRFATVLISKIATDASEAEGSNTNNSPPNSSNENNNNKKAKEVKVVTQRLWAFRPSF